MLSQLTFERQWKVHKFDKELRTFRGELDYGFLFSGKKNKIPLSLHICPVLWPPLQLSPTFP